jgi:CBS domain-containing protein
MKTIADIAAVKRPQINMVEANTPVIDALSIMKTNNLSYIIVSRNGAYVGIFTERDYAQKVIMMGREWHITKVEDVMSSNLPTVSSGETVENCMRLMNAFHTRFLPVFDGFEFKAVISMSDLILVSVNNKEHEELLRYSSEKVF